MAYLATFHYIKINLIQNVTVHKNITVHKNAVQLLRNRSEHFCRLHDKNQSYTHTLHASGCAGPMFYRNIDSH